MDKTNDKIDYGKHFDEIKAEPFKPNYSPDQLGEMSGYSKAMKDLYMYLQVVTEFKPENRYIDSVPLLDGIKQASSKIQKLLADYKPDPNDIPKDLYISNSLVKKLEGEEPEPDSIV